MSRYYKDDYGRWKRRLLALDGLTGKRFIDIALTSDSDEGWTIVKEERLRYHRIENLIDLVDQIPSVVQIEMGLFLGGALTERLLEFNYIKELGLENILRFDKVQAETQGIPVARVSLTKLWGQTL